MVALSRALLCFQLITFCYFYKEFDYPNGEPRTCKWEGCSYTCKQNKHLVSHLRSHTQEKVIACPQCGALFSAIPKFCDHLHRQIPTETLEQTAAEDRQCPYCPRVFANKSLRNAHVNRHINNHICPLCKLTLRTKSGEFRLGHKNTTT